MHKGHALGGGKPKNRDKPDEQQKVALTSGDPIFGPDALASRIQAALYGAVGSLPRALRTWAGVICQAANLRRLTEAMMHWIRGGLEKEEFGRLYLGRDADDPLVNLLHDAVPRVERAMDHIELGDAAAKIAAAIQVVGPDRWPRFLAELEQRVLDSAVVAAIEERHDHHPHLDHSGAPGLDGHADESAGEAGTATDGTEAHPAEHPALPPRGAGEHPRQWGGSSPNLPPVRNPAALKPGPASRPAQGSSLWDNRGGEWRYQQGDAFHFPHWDYNDHSAPGSPWRSVAINGSSPWKP